MEVPKLDETELVRRFVFEPIEVTVHKNAEPDPRDDHVRLVTITVKDNDGLPDKMLTVCACHTRRIARMLDKAADAAEGIEEGAHV
jgi:hypothetical protein